MWGLVEGLQAVSWRDVYQLHNQAQALRLVALVDRLYDAGIPLLATGLPLDEVFDDTMLSGGYRKKYLRATSRMIALTRLGVNLRGHSESGITLGEIPQHKESSAMAGSPLSTSGRERYLESLWIERILQRETAGGLIIVGAAFLAVILANSPLGTPISVCETPMCHWASRTTSGRSALAT